MIKNMQSLLAGAFLAITLPAMASAVPADVHVAVISVDGLAASQLFSTPTCVPAGGTIRKLEHDGAYSRGVRSVLPAITYPAHATMVTGLDPDDHGVIDNGLRGVWFKDRSDIKAQTLWDAVHGTGRTVAIVTWPSTYGAKVDWLVPEDLNNFSVPTEDMRKGSTPGLFDSLTAAVGKPQLLPFTNPDAGEPLDRMTAAFSVEVVKRYKPALLLAHFLDFDHRMHGGPGSPEACKALELIDGYIGSIVAAYRGAGILEHTTFFIVSDHGFLPVKQLVNVYGLLEDAGWSKIFPGRDVRKAFDLKVAGGSVAFYPPSPLDAASRTRLETVFAPRLAKKYGNVLRWVSPQQARRMGGYAGAAFSLCARTGYSFTVLPESDSAVFAEPGAMSRGMHGYCPTLPAMDAVFIASGYRVAAAGVKPKMAMKDVGPTVAAFLGTKLSKARGHDHSSWFMAGRRGATKGTTAAPAPGR